MDGFFRRCVWRRAGASALLVFSLLAACGPRPVSGPAPGPYPDWYLSLSSEKNILRGAGEGALLAEADAMALADISRQMQVHVTSRIHSRTVDAEDSVRRRVVQEVALEASRQIRRARRIRQALRNGVHYVAMEVDIRPDADILAERIRRRWSAEGETLPRHLELEGPMALTHGEVARRLRQLLTDPQGKGVRSLPLSLSRRDGGWMLGLCSETLPLAEVGGLLDFSVYVRGKAVLSLEDPSGKPLSHRLKDGDKVVFRMKGLDEPGHLSLFNVYPDGRVSLMEENLAVGPGAARIPEAAWDFFTNGILEPGTAQLDTYIAVFTKSPMDLVRFRHLSDVEGLVEGEDCFGFHRLAVFLDGLPAASVVRLLVVETR